MVNLMLVSLWHIFVVIAVVMFVLFMAFMGFCFWTSFVWGEYITMDDNNLKKKEKEPYNDY